MTIETRLAEIRARVEAATEGPWRWRNTSAPYLEGQRTRVVMAFRRMGMNGAQPVFRDADNVLQDGGRANLYGFPDAEFIAHARTDLPTLLAAVEAVMELHKPAPYDDEAECAHCVDPTDHLWRREYPCPTVQALTAALETQDTTREDPS